LVTGVESFETAARTWDWSFLEAEMGKTQNTVRARTTNPLTSSLVLHSPRIGKSTTRRAVERQTDGRPDGQTDRQTDRQTEK
jgi:hypothetical protein